MDSRQKKLRRAKARRSQLSRKLLGRFILTIIFFVVMLGLFIALAELLCSVITWQPYDPLYRILSFVREYMLLFIAVIVFIGWALITYRYITIPLGYLDEIVISAEQLATPTDEPVVLPEALSDTQNELNLLREKALRSAMAAREAEQRKNDLIVYLAHDLKTPLTSVIGYLTLLRDEPQIAPEVRAKYTGIALDKAERLEELINEFFEITKFNLTHLTLETETVNLTLMLQQVTYEFAPTFAEKKLTCRTRIQPDVELLCDPDKLERVFDNLLRNAVNYSYPGSEIGVLMEESGGNVNVVVRNRGKTIPKEKLDRLFEQFFRLDSARSSASGGSGLGLAIAKEIVELHGGTISADSANETITFAVTLPGGRTKGK